MMMRVLFVCIHNSARSQMAEALLNQLGKGRFEAESAGLEPGSLNPLVVKSMQEAGIDISRNRTKDVFELLGTGKNYHYVITVCDEASGERCPVFPGMVVSRMHWSFPDPSQFKGSDSEKLDQIRGVREDIRGKVLRLIQENAKD